MSEARSTTATSSRASLALAVYGLLPREPITIRSQSGPAMVMTLEASTAEATFGDQRFAIDRTTWLVVPARAPRFILKIRMPSSRACVLHFNNAALFAATEKRYKKLGFDRKKLETRWLSSHVTLLPRTVWVHEIVHRYVFEREALHETNNLATKFLEIEILKELFFLFRDREDEGADRATAAHRYSAPIERAVAWIEAHLFEPKETTMKQLAKRAGASESTLLRGFHRELGTQPGEYARTRRLDEALLLLKSGRYSIAEVATRTGYDNPTSFGFAFRERFGKAPSQFLDRTRPRKRSP